MRTKVLTILTCLMTSLVLGPIVTAGPPVSGQSAGKGVPTWLNPTEWSMPSLPSKPNMPDLPKMPWSKEPARIKKKAPGMVDTMKASTKSGWNKTKRALDPTRIFNSDLKPAPKKSETQSADDGFFGSMFKPKEDKEIRTVNDFLSQPQPR